MEATREQVREVANRTGLSMTRAERACRLAPNYEQIQIGIDEEQRLYDATHKPIIERQKRRDRAQNYHDKLYARAMELATDVDDMDVVEHYCQGHIDRLKEFIAAREK